MRFDLTFYLLDGHKRMTSRIPAQQWYEWYRDVNMNPRFVMAEGPNDEKRPIRLHFCTIMPLGFVKERYFWEEGFSSPQGFEEDWIKLHGRFEPTLQVCSLVFEVPPLPLRPTRSAES